MWMWISDGKHFATFVAMRDGGINPDKDGIYLEDGKNLALS